MLKATPLVTPLKVAVTAIIPDTVDRVVTGKLALSEPWGTVTVAGTVSPAFVLARVMTMLPASFDIVTVQLLLEPAVIAFGVQLSEDSTGVDQRVRLAV